MNRIDARFLPLLLAAALSLMACGNSSEVRNDHAAEASSPAGKLGKAAHSVAKDTEKAAKVAGRELKKAAQDAREGWKEADREDKAKGRK